MNTTQDTKLHAIELLLVASLTAAITVQPVFASEDDDDDEELPFANLRALDYRNSFSIGVGIFPDDSIAYGEYNGLDESKNFVIADFSLNQSDDYDGDSTRYWTLTTERLGIDSRILTAELGSHGSYRTWISYREMPKVEWLNDGPVTPYVETDRNVFELPAAWDTTPYDPALYSPVELKYERESLQFGLDWAFRDHWSLEAVLSREDKEGYKSRGAYSPLIHITEPITYEHDQFSVTLAYHHSHYQSTLRYESSDFTNRYVDLQVDSVQLDLPPSNEYSQWSWNGALRLGQKSRLTLGMLKGSREQNDPFLPFSTNPDLNEPLPRASLDGELDVTQYRATFTTRPTRKLNLRLHYRMDDRDNSTPRETYHYVLIDRWPREERINLPYEFKKTVWGVRATYRGAGTLRTTIGIDRETFERSPYSEVAENDEDATWVKVKWSPSAVFQAEVKLEKSDRGGTDYNFDGQHFASRPHGEDHEHDGEAHVTPTRRNPGMRHHNKADRKATTWSLNATLVPNDKITAGLSFNRTREHYDETVLGLQFRDRHGYTIDLSYQPRPGLDMHAYASRLIGLSDQANSGNGGWALDLKDRTHNYGAGLTWEVIRNRFDLRVEYNHLDGFLDYDFNHPSVILDPATGANIFLDMPQTVKSTEWRLIADLHARVDISWQFEYLYMKFDTNDYALDGVAIDTNSGRGDIIFASQTPNDRVHGFRLTFVKRY